MCSGCGSAGAKKTSNFNTQKSSTKPKADGKCKCNGGGQCCNPFSKAKAQNGSGCGCGCMGSCNSKQSPVNTKSFAWG